MTPDPIPCGYTTVTPWIVGPDTRATMAFMQDAFEAEELACLEQDGVVAHAEMRVGDAVVMLFDAGPGWPPTPALLRLFVPDCAATYAAAIEAGGTSITSMTDLAFGDRVGRVRDPQGNLWWIQQRVEEIEPDELAARWTDPRWSARMAYVRQSLGSAFSA
jgi:PhnB protein